MGLVNRLGEGKLLFQTSSALRLYPFMGKARGVNPTQIQSGAPEDGLVITLSLFLEPSWCQTSLRIPLDPTGKAERGILMTGQPRISYTLAQACALERLLQSHFTVYNGAHQHCLFETTLFLLLPMAECCLVQWLC